MTKFKGITGNESVMRISKLQTAKCLNVSVPYPSTLSKEKGKINRELSLNLRVSQIMEDKEESESVKGAETPKNKNEARKVISKAHPANRYEEIIYNRGSLSIVLPDRMLLPNGVEDVLLYPTAGKCSTPVFFKNEKTNAQHANRKFLWSNDSDPDVIIDEDIDS